jgi:hypothetical protein
VLMEIFSPHSAVSYVTLEQMILVSSTSLATFLLITSSLGAPFAAVKL